ncbi:signal peptidase I [Formivibrio citricus]|uniref:Signal peptidase I n=1 Tax=Formivibrio citricus TaxID=83765 RepID=A0A1I4WET8_9NEIS|nr:signal peptidase I [Formivibrio citricus]SFN12334.1 signal peptidase I [Formivibrio citricus]
MNNWFLLGVAALILGPVLVKMGSKQERKNNEPPQLVQYGYLAVVIGAFTLLVQFFSIAAAMLVFVLVSGAICGWERFVLARKRDEAPAPDWVEYGRGFFPIILIVFVLRSFLVEPFQIPSSSMRPGLVVGDFILVNKFSYGIRTPVINNVLIPVGKPQHGDVMVFNYPENPSINYIKRVIGLPGDTVTYRNKRLTVNGQAVKTEAAGGHNYWENVKAVEQPPYGDKFPTQKSCSFFGLLCSYQEQVANKLNSEFLGGRNYQTLESPKYLPVNLSLVKDFPYRENCRYDEDGFTCKVPEGHYFMMGDNRDHSSDGRYWGFVPDKYVVGKAFFVWMNIGQPGRIGTVIR